MTLEEMEAEIKRLDEAVTVLGSMAFILWNGDKQLRPIHEEGLDFLEKGERVINYSFRDLVELFGIRRRISERMVPK